MTIFKDIVDLLHNNDCVILPGFGAFVLKKEVSDQLLGMNLSLPVKMSLLIQCLRKMMDY